MTTRKSMEKALRAEGWRRIRDKDWLALHPGFEWGKDWWICTLDGAYTRAMKNKAARESRRLKAAGWVLLHVPEGLRWINQRIAGNFTKAEALALLAQGGKE